MPDCVSPSTVLMDSIACSFRMYFHPSCSITATAPILLCHAKMFCGFDIVLSSTESGDTYQRQVLSIFSIASGICLLGVACMALYRRNKWVMPASQRHISRLGPQKEHFTITALSLIKVWVCISKGMISDFNGTWCIWSRNSCKIYYESGVSTEVCKQNTVKTKGQRERKSFWLTVHFCLCAIFGTSTAAFFF